MTKKRGLAYLAQNKKILGDIYFFTVDDILLIECRIYTGFYSIFK